MTDKTECCVCLDKKVCLNTKCSTCKESICINCYEKIAEYEFDKEKEKSIFTMKCVICRKNNKKYYSNFKKNDIIMLATSVNKLNQEDKDFYASELLSVIHKYNELLGYFEKASLNNRFISSVQLYVDVFPYHKQIILGE